MNEIKEFASGGKDASKENDKFHLDVELSLNKGKVMLNKCVTNEWPAPLLMDVIKTISDKLSDWNKQHNTDAP